MIIIKIGGGSRINLEGVIKDLASIKEKCLIIHGANSLRNSIGEKLGIKRQEITSLSGYTSILSDSETIDLQMMVYAGLRNKRIVELCQQNGINAIGLSGLDGRLIQGKRNSGIKVVKDGKKKIIRDLSGKPKNVNFQLLDLLLERGYMPVISVPIIDENGYAVNSENDDIVTVFQKHYRAERVIHLIEEKGFLRDKDNHQSLIKYMSLLNVEFWMGKVEGRIKRKLFALSKLIKSSPDSRVFISDGRVLNPVRDALAGRGTAIKK